MVLSILVAESRDENSILVARNVLGILHPVSLAQVLLSMDHVTLEKHSPTNLKTVQFFLACQVQHGETGTVPACMA